MSTSVTNYPHESQLLSLINECLFYCGETKNTDRLIQQIVKEIFDQIKNRGEKELKIHENPRRFLLEDAVLVLPCKFRATRFSGSFKIVTLAHLFNKGSSTLVAIAKPSKQDPLLSKTLFDNEKTIFYRCEQKRIKGICYPTHIFTYRSKTGVERHRMVFPAYQKTLLEVLRDIPSTENVKLIQRQLLQIGVSLEDAGCTHQDIKPENILITENKGDVTVALCDVSSIVFCEDTSSPAIHGTLSYFPPEYIFRLREKKLPKEFVTPKVNVWGIGLIFLLLEHYDESIKTVNKPEDRTLFDERTKWYNQGKIPDFDFLIKIESRMNTLISRMLSPRPENRCSAREALTTYLQIYPDTNSPPIENNGIT